MTPRFRRANRPPHSLLNRLNGTAPRDVRDVLGKSPAGNLDDLRRELEQLKRTVSRLRLFRGLRLGDARTPVVPDADGWIDVYSPNESITSERDPNKKVNVVALSVDPDLIPEACDCCFEDVTWLVQIIGAPSVTGQWVIAPETCTATLVLTFACDPCADPGDPG